MQLLTILIFAASMLYCNSNSNLALQLINDNSEIASVKQQNSTSENELSHLTFPPSGFLRRQLYENIQTPVLDSRNVSGVDIYYLSITNGPFPPNLRSRQNAGNKCLFIGNNHPTTVLVTSTVSSSASQNSAMTFVEETPAPDATITEGQGVTKTDGDAITTAGRSSSTGGEAGVTSTNDHPAFTVPKSSSEASLGISNLSVLRRWVFWPYILIFIGIEIL